MSDTIDATTQADETWVGWGACIHLGDSPPVTGTDLSGRKVTLSSGYVLDHGSDSVSVELSRDGRVSALGSLDQHQAFVTAYQAQLDQVRTARALAAEQAETAGATA